MRYLKEKNISYYYMDSESSQDININAVNPSLGDINIVPTIDSVKKPDTSDTDYYLGLLANQQKLNDNSDAKSDYSSSLSEIVESEKKDSDTESESSSSRSRSRSESIASSRKSAKTPRYSPKHNPTFNAPTFSKPVDENSIKESRMKKIELLRKLSELKSKGYDLSKTYDFSSSIEEMEYEYELLKSFANKRNGIKLFKSCLCNGISIIEMLNDKYDPFDFHLTGWSEHMSVEVDSYEEVLEELYEKYKGTGKSMPPEVKLILLIVASASAYHFSKSTFKNLPGVDQAMRNNPDLIAKMLNPKKEPSQFQTQQEIHIQRQKEIAIQREREARANQQARQPIPNPINPIQSQATRQDAPVLKAPSNVQNILQRIHSTPQNDNLDDYNVNNSETQESSSNNDRIIQSTSASDRKGGRKKKQIMTVL
tara:strand:- start:628 stop:1902 length:1275 start_codon:yes stop_codon:yes gene_type:complete